MVKTLPRKKNLNPLIKLIKQNPNYDSLRFKDKLPFLRDIILSSAKPGAIKKIYIFGSYTNGTAAEDSDIDICVIVNNKTNRSKMSLKIRLSLFEHNIIPCDLLVYKEDFFYNSINPEGVEKNILKEGVLIYG